MKILACLFAAVGVVHSVVAYSPIIDGALADVKIKVVDDMGEVVPDATISVTFYTAPEKVDVRRGKTDAQGCFSAKGRCIGEAYAWIRKDGYYETKIGPTFRVLPDKDAERLRKWSEGTVETMATLKKKRHPAKLILKGGTFQELKYPATNVVMGLDLQQFDWCPPYGNGKYDDLHKTLEFVSSDESILTASAEGIVTAIKEGSAYIIAYAADGAVESNRLEITVVSDNKPVESISITDTLLTVIVEKQLQLKAEVLPEDTFANVLTCKHQIMGCQLNKTFRFKQFCIESGGQSMSVGTDGVLLGAWAEAPQATTILDIGTGSGVIALMLAQRFPHAAITGIDINELAIEIARKNANSSPFKQNTEFINIDARSFVADKKFDLIVSNPPFFPMGSLESGTARAKARSFETLTLQQLIECASNNISKQGTFAVIIPYDLAENFEFLAWEKDFFPVRCTDVVTVSNKPPKRKLMQFAPSSKAIKEQTNNTLTLTTSDGAKTDEYISLTKDFYLDK